MAEMDPTSVFGGMSEDKEPDTAGPTDAFSSMIKQVFPDLDEEKIMTLWEAIKECTEAGYE